MTLRKRLSRIRDFFAKPGSTRTHAWSYNYDSSNTPEEIISTSIDQIERRIKTLTLTEWQRQRQIFTKVRVKFIDCRPISGGFPIPTYIVTAKAQSYRWLYRFRDPNNTGLRQVLEFYNDIHGSLDLQHEHLLRNLGAIP